MKDNRYNLHLHRIALLTAAATFPLIFMGGLVTSHGAGMSVPDWPNSYGYNMFLFPPRLWIGGILYEHTHRLMGTVVGMLSIALTIVAWRIESRRWVRWLATSVLGAVILQGVLGGLRVVLVKLDLAIVHACVAQAFFCLSALVCVATSRWWNDLAKRGMGASPMQHGRGAHATGNLLPWLATAAVVVIYAQLIIGAVMRHELAGLAIPDFPASYGNVLPPANAQQLSNANAMRAHLAQPLEPVTLAQIWIHFAHRIGAAVVTIAILALVFVILHSHGDEPALLAPACTLVVLLAAQVTLGILTVVLRKPADVASLHVAVGALVLVTIFVIAVRSMRLYARHGRLAQANDAHERVANTTRKNRLAMTQLNDVILAPLDSQTERVSARPSRVVDFYELTKPRMNFLVVITTMVGFYMASDGGIDWLLLLYTLIGTALTAAGASVLNQFAERRYDALMPRTSDRPVPAGRIAPRDALLYGVALGVTGVTQLALFVNPLTAILGAATLLLYVFVYTPAKRITTLNTVIGAIPGAIPPVMGFAAVHSALSPAALAVFGILFFWQMPHFLAIAILYRDDYARGGFRMLPVVDEDLTATSRQIVLYSLALIPVSMMPVFVGMAGSLYFAAALLLGLAFMSFGVSCAASRGKRIDARKLFFASIIYLPVLLGMLMSDKL